MDSLNMDKSNLPKNELILRRLLWANHGHMGLYGDDGELQCQECPVDFLRDSVDRIADVLSEAALYRAAKETCLAHGLSYTDPRTGVTTEPNK